MHVADILEAKGHDVCTIHPDVMLDVAVRTMVDYKIGSLLVTMAETVDGQALDTKNVVGIVTERDILYYCARSDKPLSAVSVSEVMTRQLGTGSPADSIDQVMGWMTERRIRHLPVYEAGKLVGLISIGDIVKYQFERLALENEFMKDYIQK